MTAKTPLERAAREAVLAAIADAHDRFSEKEQIYTASGQHPEAEGAHRYALWCLRAYRAEMDDPDPRKWS